jgi:menaquinone-dependent protoporphyrinogen IX oxidase
MPLSGASLASPRVLFVYFTYTQQSLKVAEAMADVLRARGCEVRLARIDLTDSRYAEPFTRFPLRHAIWDVLRMLPAQLLGVTGQIRIPVEVDGEYELVIIGSPTWWLKTSVPVRSFLKSDIAGRLLEGKPFAVFVVCRRYWRLNLRAVRELGRKRGGHYVEGTHFSFAGGQVRSLLSLISYLGIGESRDRYLGINIPATNLQPGYLDQARMFATELVASVDADAKPETSGVGWMAKRANVIPIRQRDRA